jgi:hypothetical protein
MAGDQKDDADKPLLLISWHVEEATRDVSLGAGALLLKLIDLAAEAGSDELEVRLSDLAKHLRDTKDQNLLPAQFSELRLKGLIRQIEPGVFKVAPSLWKVGPWDPDDAKYFPLA